MPAGQKFKGGAPLRFSMRIPADLAKLVKAEAEKRSLYLTDIVIEALRSHLKGRRS